MMLHDAGLPQANPALFEETDLGGLAPLPVPCERLLLASRWTGQDSAVEELLAARPQALERHEATGLRTALLHDAGWLVRWYEGPVEAVEAEWKRVQELPRCDVPRLLHRSLGAPTLGKGVQVASVHGGDGHAGAARRIQAIVQQRQQGEGSGPAEIWQALSAPSRLVRPGALGCLARHDVLALACEDNLAVEIVRLLGQSSGAPVSYQRYAGSNLQRGDVGAAYLDLPAGPAVAARVHALPRRALATASPMLGLRNVELLVLSVGRSGARTAALLAQVERLLRTLPRLPAIVVTGPCAVTRAEAVEALASTGARMSSLELASGARAAAALVERLVRARVQSGRWPFLPANDQAGLRASMNSTEPEPASSASSVNPAR